MVHGLSTMDSFYFYQRTLFPFIVSTSKYFFHPVIAVTSSVVEKPSTLTNAPNFLLLCPPQNIFSTPSLLSLRA
ncbi:MAG: hypothetical protein POELPBGB_01859 [Bacteroidia bacterium]|nr:hypothetical protein [Bacteroidia bacterium]